ncbi:MAG: HEPN domain-containing protein [Phycisphaeraceae bacterium]|nr:HEPN domain-containing protein [Phycisphaeraceae bacterium]
MPREDAVNRSREHAQFLLSKAKDDLRVVRLLEMEPSAPRWATAFHAQQAAEKAIKAVLASRGIRYPHTHDLTMLINLVAGTTLSMPPHVDRIAALTVFAVQQRYGEDSPNCDSTPIDQLLDTAKKTIQWAESAMADTSQ